VVHTSSSNVFVASFSQNHHHHFNTRWGVSPVCLVTVEEVDVVMVREVDVVVMVEEVLVVRVTSCWVSTKAKKGDE